ncbi:hypothetical protein FRC20_009827 [Serendipita sp. 405]|nr:hypothetical protein FRC20_009827 [Serendipita sp. 405]
MDISSDDNDGDHSSNWEQDGSDDSDSNNSISDGPIGVHPTNNTNYTLSFSHERQLSDIHSGPQDVDYDISFQEVHPSAGWITRTCEPPIQRSLRLQHEGGETIYTIYRPFSSKEELGLSYWLHESGLSKTKIDAFLKSDYVKAHPLSYKTSKALHSRIEEIAYTGPEWKFQLLVPSYGTPIGTVEFLYRNPMEVIQYLFSRPALAESMEYEPKRIYRDESKEERLYSEMSTGDWWWRVQNTLPEGATVVPVILGSDSTHLTQFGGGKKAWPVYLTIGNVSSRVRNRPSQRAWMVVAYIPVVKFSDGADIQGTLANRLYHQCMELVFSPLIEAGVAGTTIVDSKGKARNCYPRIAAHLADHPEQALVNVAAAYNSPVTTASYHNLGDPHPHPPRTRKWILEQIHSVCGEVDPADIKSYQKAARARGLNGVHKPYWRNLPGYQPELCACPDILHGVIRFWRDHVLKWSLYLTGENEYDARLKAIQPVVGYKHFRGGIKHLSQWTGREDRELQRVHVALVSGCQKITPKTMRNLRAFHDFLYLVQYRYHSTKTLTYLRDALQEFHNTKDEYIRLGARKTVRGQSHFNIPKLSGLSSFGIHIPELGTSPQFSTEIIESNHRTLVKYLYTFTNRKGFLPQMCQRLDRSERLLHQAEAIDWYKRTRQQQQLEAAFASYSPGFRRIAMDRYQEALQPPTKPSRHSITSHLQLSGTPYRTKETLWNIALEYKILGLSVAVHDFLKANQEPGEGHDAIRVRYVDVWTKLRIQASDIQDEDNVSQCHTVEAVPPSDSLPYGRCHCVLVHDTGDAATVGIAGYRVAQVRLIFKISLHDPLGSMHNMFLAYVQYFSQPKQTPDKNINMYTVSREDRRGIRAGVVVPLDSIVRFVQLVPKFGATIHPNLTAENSADVCRDFYINSFADKEIYQAVW